VILLNQEHKAILLIGGTGSRFGSETPKQFHRLAGKKVYIHTLETFLRTKLFKEIIIVCPQKWVPQVKEELAAYLSVVIVVEGGATRQESSYRGVLACGESTDIVVIHDGVRPFVSEEIIKENVAKTIEFGAVDTCIPSADTLVHSIDSKKIDAIPKRADYLRGQTPQSFRYSLILRAHQEAKGTDNSDDCSLVLRSGHPVHVVMGSEENIKITSELDLLLAEQILRLRHLPLSMHNEQGMLEGKRYAVTGGMGGIGKAICELLQKEGAVAIPISRSAPVYSANLTSHEQTEAVFTKIFKEYGMLDGLINSIGILKTNQLEHASPEEIQCLIATNLTGVIYSCKAARLKRGAHIINIASSSYVRGRKNFAVYSCAKAAVVNFTQGMAEERPDLCINALIPQRTHTAMRLDNFPDEDPSSLLDPTDVAAEALRLLKQSFLTGTLIEVKKK
jgi:2-C-methyl-D-erythritol 4-phosphate cytidylyltransferase